MRFRHDRAVELRSLRYLLVTAEAGSVTQAAVRLRVAQPALSRRLSALEREVGAVLLERNSRGVVLTAAGEAFLTDVRRILADVEQAVAGARARARGELGELKIGYAPSPTAELLPAALAAFQTVAPAVKVHLQDLAGDELLDALSNDRLDLALMVDPGELRPADIQFKVLRRYRHHVAFGPGHRFGKLAKVPLALVAAQSLVIYNRREYREYFETLKQVLQPITREFNVAVECDGLSSLSAAIASGRGVAIVPEVFTHVATGRIQLRPLTPDPAPLLVGYARHLGATMPPALKRFLAVLERVAK